MKRYPETSIGKIHLSVSPDLIDVQFQHASDCSPRDNRGISFKVIYSFHLYITHCTEYGLELPKSKVIELERLCDWENVSTSH